VWDLRLSCDDYMKTAVFGTWHSVVWQKCTNASRELAVSTIQVHDDSRPFECVMPYYSVVNNNTGTRRRCMVSITPWPLYSWGKCLSYSVNVRLGRPHTQSRCFLKEKKCGPYQKLKHDSSIIYPLPHNHHITTTKLCYPSSAYGTLEFS